MPKLPVLQLIIPGDGLYTTIQSAINAAARSPHSAVWIAADYFGSDGYVNPSQVPIFDMRFPGSISFGSGGSTPGGSDTQVQFNNTGSFGGNSRLVWDNVNYVLTVNGLLDVKREVAIGSALNSGNFVLSSAWGTGRSVGSIVGFDSAHQFTVTAGTGATQRPTIVFTFADGAWANAPLVIAQMTGGTGEVSDFSISQTTTTYTLTYNGTPVNALTYTVTVFVKGY